MKPQEFAGYAIARMIPGGNGVSRLLVGLNKNQERVFIRHLTRETARRRKHRKRFLQTIDILKDLQNPNVIHFLKSGIDDKLPYAVMEYIESKTLRDMILYKDAILTHNTLVIIRQLANALYYIHSKGYLHLDIKPENILIERNGHLTIVDFDLAVQKKNNKPLKIKELSGTTTYLPPETIQQHIVDERTDIYSFGVCCYEMLTFHKPFEGDRLQDARTAQITSHTPTPSPRQYNPDIPAQLEQLILKCLAKNPRERYPSMTLIIKDLESKL